ncbi:glycosyltransferase family 2 protein [Qipengyuania spongiae]|uniref:Glycosyltransferase family 2 protein n=1 Tax=Qipengyuania spongiae TaxID=2909673 RepID=A0ABY5SY57_9SPHN|nr:glycosyltransferase family A protein [Qipengyuania spongiae]UVI39095.1 glycosyltransferase family 2 protein [Qipengyuania spongiae]
MTELSIIICTRNRAPSLGPMLAALQAVRSERAWELLLIDNASTDETRQILDAAAGDFPDARVETVTAIGLGAARDAAWRMAKGDIVLFTDDDCYVAPDIVDATLEAFAKHPQTGLIGGRILLHDPSDYPVTIDERTETEMIAPYSFAPPGTLQGANFAFRRSALEAIGGIDTMLGAGTPFPCEDIDAVAACLWAGIPGRFDPTMVVRHHHGRKAADFPLLMEGYDRGRGAYFAKYMLRPDSRDAYLSGWMRERFSVPSRSDLAALLRELRSALRYLRARRAWAALLVGVPLAAGMWLALAARIAGRKLASTVRRRSGEL